MNFDVATFYKFVELDDLGPLQEKIEAACDAQGVKGTILLAREGINATIAGSQEGVKSVLDLLRDDQRFEGLKARHASYEKIPFQRLKVKIKEEIVTLRAEADPTKKVGVYLSPEEWNELIQEKDVLVIDTRNDFEVQYGTFEGATNPETERFGEFPEYVEKKLKGKEKAKIAMFCTGGIRCEKATSYLLDQGFEEVYHLEGGILRYIDEVDPEKSLWRGECFVFDDRRTY